MTQEELQQQIKRLAAAKDALIIAHNYERDEIQEIADITGDSLALSIEAQKTDKQVIVFCGVHFMAESAAILAPEKTVLLPRADAGCPMADMVTAKGLQELKRQHPDAAVVTYVNSSAAVKAESDICCTSSNAISVARSVSAKKLLLVPDRNLGRYIASKVPEKECICWEGFCPTHDKLQVADIEKAKAEIEQGFEDALSKADKTFRLNNSEIFEVSIGKRVVAKEIEDTEIGIPVYSANVFDPFGFINKELLKDFDKPTVLWGIDGDWMVNYIEKGNPFYPTDHCGVLRVKGKEIHPRYLTWVLNRAGKEVRFSRNHRASIDRIKGLSIKVPTFELQKKLAEKTEKLENRISEAKIIIESASDKKQKVMDKYLK